MTAVRDLLKAVGDLKMKLWSVASPGKFRCTHGKARNAVQHCVDTDSAKKNRCRLCLNIPFALFQNWLVHLRDCSRWCGSHEKPFIVKRSLIILTNITHQEWKLDFSSASSTLTDFTVWKTRGGDKMVSTVVACVLYFAMRLSCLYFVSPLFSLSLQAPELSRLCNEMDKSTGYYFILQLWYHQACYTYQLVPLQMAGTKFFPPAVTNSFPPGRGCCSSSTTTWSLVPLRVGGGWAAEANESLKSVEEQPIRKAALICWQSFSQCPM